MNIEIYEVIPAPEGAVFPAMDSATRLYAVAPLWKRQDVEIWCSNKNDEAEEAGVRRRYKYNVTAVEIWS